MGHVLRKGGDITSLYLIADYDSTNSDGVVGVTDEVVAFAMDIAMHLEIWLDFPFPNDEDDDEDFHMSDAQQDHVLAIKDLVPSLSALRIKLCPDYMRKITFWKIYIYSFASDTRTQCCQTSFNTQDFHLSDAQQDHPLAIEDLVPGLSAFRIKHCPNL
ncbi:unnamed protein product [Lactuca virosa]|uniref:BSD domain-containing protein n=1 Tax=Lactuca virosa TaxID=75947 RepID=A0AAU9LV62_9ASTR|nr:unnamed protein product [Lactuca virosa]